MAVQVQVSPAPSGAALRLWHVLLLGVGERPDFIHLHPLGLHVPHIGIMEGHASLASVNQQLDDRVLAGTRQPRHGADGIALAQQVQDLGAGLAVQYFHTDPYAYLLIFSQ